MVINLPRTRLINFLMGFALYTRWVTTIIRHYLSVNPSPKELNSLMKACATVKYLLYGVCFAMLAGKAIAHDIGSAAGAPVCLEGNYMMADAMNTPFSSVAGPGRVVEMNIFTGERGINILNPFNPGNLGTPICDNSSAVCELGPGGGVGGPFGDGSGPWKPTGVLSGGQNGHVFISSAAQHQITEFHRDSTPIRTAPTLPTHPGNGPPFGQLPRLLGTQFMPNGNMVQTVCDANFFNASNSDQILPGESDPAGDGNSSNLYFPPVYGTAERGANGRILVLDQDTLETIDEYSMPKHGDLRWNCPAGISFTSEGMLVSMFHGAAVFVIDWKAGVKKTSSGVGANKHGHFNLDRKSNRAKVIRVIDVLNEDMDGDGIQDAPDAAMTDANRRDSLRANTLDEAGNVYGTFRARSKDCLRGQAPGVANPPGGVVCNPSVFRQHVFVAAAGGNVKTGTIAMDPGVNIIAGIRINRISGPGCTFVRNEITNNSGTLTGNECDIETLYLATSAGNAGCDADGDGSMGPGHPANQCFIPGGTVYEYRIDAAHIDGGNGASCTGDPNDGYGAGEGNEGCALPIAEFDVKDSAGIVEKVDPRMLMHIHQAFGQ